MAKFLMGGNQMVYNRGRYKTADRAKDSKSRYTKDGFMAGISPRNYEIIEREFTRQNKRG